VYSWCGPILNSNGKFSVHENKKLTLKLLLKEAVVSSRHPGAACCIDTRRQARIFGVGGTRFLCDISDFLLRSYDVGLIGLFSWILICGCKSMEHVMWNTVNISVHSHNIIKLNLCILEDEDLINSQNSLVLAFQCILYFSKGFMATTRPNYIDSALCPFFYPRVSYDSYSTLQLFFHTALTCWYLR
jgi:hypothetical protein